MPRGADKGGEPNEITENVRERHLEAENEAQSPSPSTDFPVLPVIRFPCSADFSPGRGGFLQLPGVTLPPCCPYQPRRSVSPHQSLATIHAAFARNGRDRPSGYTPLKDSGQTESVTNAAIAHLGSKIVARPKGTGNHNVNFDGAVSAEEMTIR
jgi:hypothetical protein